MRKEKTHPKTFRIHLSNYAIHQDKTVSNHGLRKDYGTREERYRKPFFDFINSPHLTRCFHLAPNEISISKLNSDCELYSAALFMSQDISGYCFFLLVVVTMCFSSLVQH